MYCYIIGVINCLRGRLAEISFLLVVFIPFYIYAAPIADGCDKFLGNISTAKPPSNFADYWNQVTLENNGKWENVEPNRDQMNWGPVTEAYNYCIQKGFPYRHHTFLWNEQYPKSWFDRLSASEKKAEVEELIKEFGQKFPKTAFIDVVNEAREKSPSWKDALGGAGVTGYDWIVWAFKKCRQYIPDAKLAMNEYFCEYSLEYVTEYLKIVKVLKDSNLIDCIGIQTHDGETKKGYEMGVLKKCIDSLATAGIPIYSTELDLSGNDQEQLDWYKKIFPIIWEHPAIYGVTLWGWTDSWLLDLSPPRDARLIIDNRERPALKWLKEYVPQHKKTITTYTYDGMKISPAASSRSSPLSRRGGFYAVQPQGGTVTLELFDFLGRCGYSNRINTPASSAPYMITDMSIPRTPFVVRASDGVGSRMQRVVPLR